MAWLRQTGYAERELARSLTEVDRKDGVIANYRECPAATALRLFVEGKCSDQQAHAILTHLGSCQNCAYLLQRIRTRHLVLKRTFIALAAAAAAVSIVLWIVLARPTFTPSGVATIDLRQISPTRGIERYPEPPTQVHRSSGGLRLILPIGSEGKYECEVRPEHDEGALLRASGETSQETHDVILNLPIKLSSFAPGRYSLMLRREGSQWVYYRLDLR